MGRGIDLGKGTWMSCAFCLIAEGSAAADVVWSDERHLAFLDRRPLFPGHVLVVPRRHVATLTDLTEDEVGPLMTQVRRLAAAVEQAVDAQGTFVAMNNRVSQSVPHLHVHVVPRRKGDGLKGFFWPRHPYASDEERERVAASIRREVAAR